MSAEEYIEIFIRRGELVGWTPNLESYEIVERSPEGDEEWNVSYSVTSAMTAVSSRDFVSINFHRVLDDGCHLLMTLATDHPDKPKKSNIVRGAYMPSGALLRPIPGQPGRCEFYWVNNCDMKGFLLRSVINMVMSTFTLEFGKALIQQAKKVSGERKA